MAVGHSAVGAEIVAADHAFGIEGLPALSRWEKLLDRNLHLDICLDTQATAILLCAGRAPALRHTKRTHGVSISWAGERIVSDDVELRDCTSRAMAADNFTQHFVSRDSGFRYAI